MSEILSREDAVRAFLDGKELETNYNRSKDGSASWIPFESPHNFWHIIAHQSADFRLAVPRPRFKVGDFALVRKVGDVPRYANAFRNNPDALYVRVLHCYNDGTLDVTNGTFSQVVGERDLSPVEE